MKNILLAILVMTHVSIFCVSFYFLYRMRKSNSFSAGDIKTLLLLSFVISIIGFFGANHFSFLSKTSSVMLSIGYGAFPITQITLLILSYPVTNYFFKNTKYSLVFSSIVLSIPLSFLYISLLSGYYWEFLGRNIYGS